MIVVSGSLAEDLSFVALHDLSEVVTELGLDEARVIGGHMVMLHVYRHGLGSDLYRATADADLGVPPLVVKKAGVIEALEARGYTRHGGNRYRRPVPELQNHLDAPFAVIDVLVPAYTSRPRDNTFVSPALTTTEVPGLALALTRPAVHIRLAVSLVTGPTIELSVRLPDEPSSFDMKALAWRQRAASKDIFDAWRMLEVLAASGTSPDAPSSEAAAVVRAAFSDMRAPGTLSLATELSLGDAALRARWTRIQALMLRALPSV